MKDVSITSQINAVHTAVRALENPARNIMRGSERQLLVEQLKAASRSLDWCRDNLDDIRAAINERRTNG